MLIHELCSRFSRSLLAAVLLIPVSSAFADLRTAAPPAPTAESSPCQDKLKTAGAPHLHLADPVSLAQMLEARAMVQTLQPFLQDWSVLRTSEALNPAKVTATLQALRKAKVEVDGPAFRSLFLIMQRYLLSAKGAEGRLRPLAEVLEVHEGEARRAVSFLAQLDVLCSQNQMTAEWPVFMVLSRDPVAFIKWELAAQLTADPLRPRIFRKEVGSYIEQVLAGVVGRRIRYLRLEINALGNQLTVSSPVAVYKLNLHLTPVERRSIAPLVVGATTAWGRSNDKLINSQSDVAVNDPEARSYFRTVIRADAFLHPHLIPPALEIYPLPVEASEIQAAAARELVALDKFIAGLVQPTGEGKTVTIEEYVRLMQKLKWGGKRAKIFFVVENIQICKQTVESFQRDLGLDPSKIAMLFGDREHVTMGPEANPYVVEQGSTYSPPLDFDLVVMTRSTYFARQSSVKFWIENEQAKGAAARPFAVIVDEAHHVGTEDGQFTDILDSLKTQLAPTDRILLASATMDHPKVNIIRDVLNGAVVATHLTSEELARLRAGVDVQDLALTQFLRGTIDGYINPIEDDSIVLMDGTAGGKSLRDRLNMANIADPELYKFVSDTIRNIRVPDVMDRYLFFEVRQERAEEGAALLQKNLGRELGPNDDQFRSAWFMHSDLSPLEQTRRLDWFRDRAEFRGTRIKHKYLDTVGQLLEGVDIRGVNGIVVMRNLSNDRLVQQILGRGARLEPFKTGLRLIDVPGRTVAYLERAGDLWKAATYQSAPDMSNWGQSRAEDFWDSPIATAADLKPVMTRSFTSRPVDLEPVFKIEREKMVSAPALVVPDETSVFLTEQGAARLLAFNQKSLMTQENVQLKTWFAAWVSRFPVAAQMRAATDWTALALSDESLKINALRDGTARSAARGFALLARMFNELSPVERLGFSPLTSAEAYDGTGQSRVLAALDPRFNFQKVLPAGDRSGILQLIRSNNEEMKTLRDAVINGQMFAGPRPRGFTQAFEQNNRRGAGAILADIQDMFTVRPVLKTAKAEQILRTASFYIQNPANRNEDPNVVASYYLAMLINNYFQEAGMTAQKPWNLNGFFGVTDGADAFVNRATTSDVWTTLNQIELELKKVKK